MSPLMAQSRHSTGEFRCPLLGAKRTDITWTCGDVRFWPKADITHAQDHRTHAPKITEPLAENHWLFLPLLRHALGRRIGRQGHPGVTRLLPHPDGRRGEIRIGEVADGNGDVSRKAFALGSLQSTVIEDLLDESVT